MAKLVPQNHPALHSIAEERTEEDFNNGTVAKILKNLRAAIKTYNVDGFAAVAIAAPQKRADARANKRIKSPNPVGHVAHCVPPWTALINPAGLGQSIRFHTCSEPNHPPCLITVTWSRPIDWADNWKRPQNNIVASVAS